MSTLDGVVARRLAKILQKQITEALSNTILGNSNNAAMHADTINTIKQIMDKAPINDYSVGSPVLATFKGIDKDLIITKKGHYRPRYEVYLTLSDDTEVVIKSSRSLRKIKEYYNNLDIDTFMWCDISFKPTNPVDYIKLNIKVEQNA